MFDNVLNGVLGPLLNLPPLYAILIVSFVVSLFITLIYKLTTDQEKMKALKGELKVLQKEMRSLAKEPDKMMKVQKKAMDKNMQYMMSSFKPMIITMLPILLVFGWLGANMAYYPLVDNEPFTVTASFGEDITGFATLNVPNGLEHDNGAQREITDGLATWEVSGDPSEVPYTLEIDYEGQQYHKDVIITAGERKYESPEEKFKGEPISSISVNNEKVVVMNLFGWKIGWLGSYIIFSVVFSMTLRKIIGVY